MTAKFKVEEQKTATLLECRKLVQRKALNLFLRDTNRSVIDLNSRLRNANREKSIKDRNWNQFQFSLLMPHLVYQIELINVYFMYNLRDVFVATIENLIAYLKVCETFSKWRSSEDASGGDKKRWQRDDSLGVLNGKCFHLNQSRQQSFVLSKNTSTHAH